MLTLLLQFTALAGVIVIAGTFLAKYADAIGDLTGLGGSLAGILLLAVATSLPELAVDCSAAVIGAPDLAIGDLFGSSLFNLLILAVIDLVHRQRGRIFSRISRAHAISAATSIVLTAIALLGILVHHSLMEARPSGEPWGLLGRWDPATLAIGITYIFLLRVIYYDQQYQVSTIVSDAPVEETRPIEFSLKHAVIGYLISASAIFMAGPILAYTADRLAEISGLGHTFVGTTLVALSTSLPEIATTTAAVRMGAIEMAVGNIFGSNTFNMVILLAVDAFYPAPLLASVSPVHSVSGIAVVVITSIGTIGLLYRAKKRYWFVEPDASLVVVLVIGALGLVYLLS